MILMVLREQSEGDDQTGRAEELTEEIYEAGVMKVAYDCGTRGDSWSTFRRCL